METIVREEARGDMIENPPDEDKPNEEAKLDSIMSFMMEQFGQINDKFEKQHEKLDQMNENLRKLGETIDCGFNKLNETLDSTSGSSNEKIKSKEDQSTMLSQNKSNRDKEKIKHIETNRRGIQKKQIIKKIQKTKDIGKIGKRKLIKTREELEMMKNGLLEMFNLCLLYTS